MWETDIEKAILSCMINDAESCERGVKELTKSAFITSANAELFQSIKRCASNGAVDLTSLCQFTKDNGNYAYQIASVWYPEFNFNRYLDALHSRNRRSKAIAAAKKAIAAAEGNAEGWEALMQDVAKVAQAENGCVDYVGSKAIEAIESLFAERESSIKTGFPALDRATKGMSRGEMIVIAARPSMGKTSFAMNIATNAASEGNVTAIFSLETREIMLIRRAVYAMARKGEQLILAQNEQAMLASIEAAGKISDMPLYIHDRATVTVEDIARQCYKLKQAKGKIDLVVIDYLQLITGRSSKGATRENVVSEISRRIKTLAMDLDVPIVILSQLSRSIEQRADKTPLLSDLRESGAIEQDADVVLFITESDDGYEDERKLILAKNRNGKIGSIDVKWYGSIYRFDPKEK